MKTLQVSRLNHLSPSQLNRLKAVPPLAALGWNAHMELHQQARMAHRLWPVHLDLHRLTKGRFALRSQSVQAIFRALLANTDATGELRKTHPQMKRRYPWREKRCSPSIGPHRQSARNGGECSCRWGEGAPPSSCHWRFHLRAGRVA